MKKIKRADYEELLTELLNCFTYLISSQLGISVDNLKIPDDETSYSMLNDFKDKKIHGFHILPLYDLTQSIQTYLTIFDNLDQKFHNDLYRDALYSYIKEGYPIYGIDNKKLRNRINGLLNVRKRYEENLYKKREVLYRVLREEASLNGKWESVNQAVREAYPKITYEFELFNKEWIRNEMRKLLSQIEENTLSLIKNKNKTYNEEHISFQNRSFENKINDLRKRYKKLERALNEENSSDVLGKTLAFHSDYQEESIINHLRNCPELISEIICNCQ
ncbi:hypothetical protein KXJ74_02670 [Acinetobacter johnsonii]|jgi:arsenate reductase-like glutaredoxin family protein|nr:hypothetical protein KXJ74_02670 [Acinetobacter johnsonii]